MVVAFFFTWWEYWRVDVGVFVVLLFHETRHGQFHARMLVHRVHVYHLFDRMPRLWRRDLFCDKSLHVGHLLSLESGLIIGRCILIYPTCL